MNRMLTLIAESKTMTGCHSPITEATFDEHRPSGETSADEVMRRIASLPVNELVGITKFSIALATKSHNLAYEFQNKSLGSKAIEAYTGVVFRSFDYPSLTESEQRLTSNAVRLVSSLYGYLKPDDIIKAYRLDFNTPIAPGGKTMSSWLKKDVTISLIREIKELGGTDILNLLPNDAAKTIDWKLVKHFAKVWKIDFKELKDGYQGELDQLPKTAWRTPNSTRLKELRGHLLRQIIERNHTSPDQLLTLETDRLIPLGTPDYPDHIAFCV